MAAWIIWADANDPLVFDATTSERHSSEVEVSENPVEANALNVDNVRRKPATLALEVLVTDYPLTTKGRGIGAAAEKGRASRFVETLIDLQTKGERLEIATGARYYKNMVIKSLSIPRDKALAGALKISISFVEVQIAASKVTEKLAKAGNTSTKGQGKKEAGKKATEDGADKKPKSALASIQDNAGAITDGIAKYTDKALKAVTGP